MENQRQECMRQTWPPMAGFGAEVSTLSQRMQRACGRGKGRKMDCPGESTAQLTLGFSTVRSFSEF